MHCYLVDNVFKEAVGTLLCGCNNFLHVAMWLLERCYAVTKVL